MLGIRRALGSCACYESTNVARRNPQANLRHLRDVKGGSLHIFGPDEGVQACGDVGPGRMLEPTVIAEQVALIYSGCAGGRGGGDYRRPYAQAIDPVRYISNHSSGKWALPWPKRRAMRG